MLQSLPSSSAFALKPQRLSRLRRHVARTECFKGITVVTTREQGKNDKLQKALSKNNQIKCLELPLIEHAVGPDRQKLPAAIQAGDYDWITITSPEAALVFIEGWREAGCPQVKIAAVGGGTGDVLKEAGVAPDFVSSKALGKVLGAELPKVEGGSQVVLYPASAKASDDLQSSLEASGFTVNRLNTYDTKGVEVVDPHLLQQAMSAEIVTFGSPSAVKAWVSLVGTEVAASKISVCIGSTSARACRAAGLSKVTFPDAPGIDGWVQSIIAIATTEDLIEPKESVRDM